MGQRHDRAYRHSSANQDADANQDSAHTALLCGRNGRSRRAGTSDASWMSYRGNRGADRFLPIVLLILRGGRLLLLRGRRIRRGKPASAILRHLHGLRALLGRPQGRRWSAETQLSSHKKHQAACDLPG